MKRVLVISDLHCGSQVGLTPPGWQQEVKTPKSPTKRDKYSAVQKALWSFYEDSVKKHGPFDRVIANGDLIDGTGRRSGGTEQIAVDREQQAEMAVYALRKAISRKTKVVCTYGTAYHTGEAEDFENLVAHDLDSKIGSHEWPEIEGVVFDVKHHLSSSAVPHGRHTATAREWLWNAIWADRSLQPRASVFIRSHVHYYQFCGGDNWVGMTTPAMQAFGTKYGSRRCSGLVNVGFVVFEVNGKDYSWHPVLMRAEALAAHVTKF